MEYWTKLDAEKDTMYGSHPEASEEHKIAWYQNLNQLTVETEGISYYDFKRLK